MRWVMRLCDAGLDSGVPRDVTGEVGFGERFQRTRAMGV
jgi:hypothetical protein